MAHTILVTLNNYSLTEIKTIKTFKNINWEDVECLIFHSTIDSDFEIVKELSNLKGKVKKVIYINKNINPLYYCIFTGLDADIYDSEEYLSDNDILKYLVSNYKETGMTMKTASSDLETLAKSIAAISTSNVESLQKLVSNDFWMRTLTTAVSNVDNAIVMSSQININVVEMLEESSKLITNLEKSNEVTSAELANLNKLIYEMERKNLRVSTPHMFTTYNVPVTVPKVLYVKAYGECRYLKSFLMAYQHYLRMSKQYTSKILIAVPNLKLNIHRYRDIGTRLAQDSIDIVNYQASNIYVTHEPKKSIMDAFFNQQNVQIFIMIDLMMGDTLVKGHMVEELTAISGLSDIQRFNLKEHRCIIPVSAKASNILIPHINRYSGSNESTKRSLYFEKCATSFKKIDDIILKDGR